VPDEPLVIMTMFVFLFWFARSFNQLDLSLLIHPVSLLLLLHMSWIAVCAFFAQDSVIGFKFLLAKIWYIICFYMAAIFWHRTSFDFWQSIRWFFIVLIPVVIWAIMKHGIMYQFSFADVNRALSPLFRNHVSYAALLAVSFPYLFFFTLQRRYKNQSYWWLVVGLILLFVAINFSYTRAAYGALIFAIPYYFIVKYKLTRWFILGAFILTGFLFTYLIKDYRYMNLAPRFEKTITHTSFEDLLDATYKFQDISTMERVYRWIAGIRMVNEKPGFGFGPNNFYHHYKAYAISGFRTFVSDNPEKSGVHNYYLMTAVEQGIPGLVIYLMLIVFVMLWGERLYHKVKTNRVKGFTVLAAMSSLIIIHLLQLMNDLLETDKVGPFFFLSLAVLIKIHLDYQKEGK
jgi:O-antigen ligase